MFPLFPPHPSFHRHEELLMEVSGRGFVFELSVISVSCFRALGVCFE